MSEVPRAQDLEVPPGDWPGELSPGARVGDYVVTGVVGEGGMATVYAADHPLIGRKVAIKVIRADLGASREAFERFLQEARAVIAIGHPNIVDVFTFGRLDDGRSYFVMELLEGQTLSDTLDTTGPLALPAACDALIEVCDGLEAAHRAGVIHRDLKPQNVFLCAPTAHVKLLDFGIAKLIGKLENNTPHTRPGMTIGTPDYISPEQARGREVGPHADVYSLGVVAFEMLTGRLPFTADNPADMMAMHLGAEPERPTAVRPTLPAGVDKLILRMLAKEAADRPTLAEIRHDLLALRDAPPGVPASLASDISNAVAAEKIDGAPHRPRGRSVLVAACAGAAIIVLCSALVGRGRPLLPSLVALVATPMPLPARAAWREVPMPVLQPPTFGVLIVQAKTPAARIVVDSEERELADGIWRAQLTGPHQIVASAPGHAKATVDVYVEPGRVVVVPITLQRLGMRSRTMAKLPVDDYHMIDPWRGNR